MENSILNNKIIIIGFTAWFIAQCLKVVFDLSKYNRFDAKRFVGSGGMPSSHSSLISAVATAVGLSDGWTSTSFAIIFAIAAIVMYDATGVRKATGEQAKVLNRMVDDFNSAGELDWDVNLKELIGHSFFEVLIGALIGVGVAFALYAKL